MLANAHVPVGASLLMGSAEILPLPDGSADFLSMGYALRHIGDLTAAYAEFFRVLRPGGLLCVLEITLPKGSVARAMLKGYMRGVVPWLSRRLARHGDMPELMRYYWDTIEACVPPATVMQGITDAGFADVSCHVELGIFSAYRARKPE
jgi:demethylmenaquinone methyltransferase/2-methoxy-6-polyprenyl-1,4-benzoquinol methylase